MSPIEGLATSCAEVSRLWASLEASLGPELNFPDDFGLGFAGLGFAGDFELERL